MVGPGWPEGLQLSVVAEAKTQVWEEFREAMERNFQFQGSSGKPLNDSGRKSRTWLRLWSAGEVYMRITFTLRCSRL